MTLAATESDTERIARGLGQRDVALLQGLVHQYQYRLVRYFIFLLGTRDPVEDLAQDTWLRVLECGRSYDGESRFEPWLFAIARNLAIDHTRKRRVLSLDSNDADDFGAASLSLSPTQLHPSSRRRERKMRSTSPTRYSGCRLRVEKRWFCDFKKSCRFRKSATSSEHRSRRCRQEFIAVLRR